MIDRAFLLRLYGVSAVVCAVGAGAGYVLWHSWAIALGVIAGYVLGAIPFVTWPWMLGAATRRRRIFAVVVLVLKVALYGAALWFLFSPRVPRVNPIALVAGLSIMSVAFFLMRPAAPGEAKCF